MPKLDPEFRNTGVDIKGRINTDQKFEFSHINPAEVMAQVEALDVRKSCSGNIQTRVIKEAKEVICPFLTDCINAPISNCDFPDKLNEADVSAILKNMILTKW